jgi:hypothetical protein
MHRPLLAGVPDDLESLLARAYAAEIPADLAVTIEQRTAALAKWHPRPAPRWRLVRPSWLRIPAVWLRVPPIWRRLAMVPVVAAVLLSAGMLMTSTSASGGPAGFYESEGGYMWQHAQTLGLSETVDGYQITLERAYADGNQMMLGITVADPQARWSVIHLWRVSVADSSGGEWFGFTSAGGPVNVTTSCNILWFEYTAGLAPPGRREFSVTVSSISVAPSPPADFLQVAMDVTFSFDLTVGGGSQATPNASSESNGVTITVERIISAPSAVRLELRVSHAPPSGSDWLPNVFVSHAGQKLEAGREGTSMGSTLTTFYTGVGVDDPTGDWVVTASELIGSAPTEGIPWSHEVRFQGDWTISFSLP